jgi:predicted component of type VI protein secretion system
MPETNSGAPRASTKQGAAMAVVVRITVETGPHKDTSYCLIGTCGCLIGRGPECLVQLSGSERDRRISRNHCRLTFDAERRALGLQDLGSRNGTYLNGRPIESTEVSFQDDDAETTTGPSNMLTVGGTTLRIDILHCALEAPAGRLGFISSIDGVYSRHNCPLQCTT